MSFPSAKSALDSGMPPDAALLHAFASDTPTGFTILGHIADAAKKEQKCSCPLNCLRKKVPLNGSDILRVEMRGVGIVVDIDPKSEMAGDIFRLLGTDAARPLVETHFGINFGFANCCKILASTLKADTEFTFAEQIAWQVQPDC